MSLYPVFPRAVLLFTMSTRVYSRHNVGFIQARCSELWMVTDAKLSDHNAYFTVGRVDYYVRSDAVRMFCRREQVEKIIDEQQQQIQSQDTLESEGGHCRDHPGEDTGQPGGGLQHQGAKDSIRPPAAGQGPCQGRLGQGIPL